MRKLVTVAAATVLAMTMFAGTASAAIMGPFASKAKCETYRKAHFAPGKSDRCVYLSAKGAWYFKY